MVSCELCGEQWPRDPRLEVPCPACKARIGVRCMRPSEHRAFTGDPPHIEREELAIQRGFLGRTCPARQPKQLGLGLGL